MGFLDDAFKTILFPITGPVNGISSALSGSDEANQRADKFQGDLAGQRANARTAQYNLLNGMQAPTVSPEMERRIRALEAESAPGPLVEDPLFQGDRAALVQGGQQALSGVQNVQKGYHTSGGFSNQGSISDVYDRLGAQLAQLGQQSRAVKEQKRDVAAQARQQIADGQTAYNNAIVQAKMAIESGDAAAANAAIQSAYQAKENIAQAQRQMTGSLISAAVSGAAASMGAPRPSSGPAPAYQQQPIMVGAQKNPFDEQPLDYSSQLSYGSNIPYSLMRR